MTLPSYLITFITEQCFCHIPWMRQYRGLVQRTGRVHKCIWCRLPVCVSVWYLEWFFIKFSLYIFWLAQWLSSSNFTKKTFIQVEKKMIKLQENFFSVFSSAFYWIQKDTFFFSWKVNAEGRSNNFRPSKWEKNDTLKCEKMPQFPKIHFPLLQFHERRGASYFIY